MKTIFINMLTFGTLISSVLAITSKNPVVSVIFVISTFVNAAGYLLLLGVNFVGISYIVIYVGAIAVLFLFVIMMINVRHCVCVTRGTKSSNSYSNRITTTELGLGESPKLNIASQFKGNISSTQKERVDFQVVLSMVKATLLEVYTSGTPYHGLYLVWNRIHKVLVDTYLLSTNRVSFTRVIIYYFNMWKWLPKESVIEVSAGTEGSPKEENFHGDRVLILPPVIAKFYLNKKFFLEVHKSGRSTEQRVFNGNMVGFGETKRHFSSSIISNREDITRDSEITIMNKLKNLHLWSLEHPNSVIDRKLYNLLLREDIFLIAYDKLKSNPGNMTPGINPTTLDGLSQSWIEETINKLKDESFQFSPGRRIEIPKASGGARPLTIASPRDKIVQECVRLILEAVYEPTFSDYSHGFRVGRSCHTALKQIKQTFDSSTWFIEGDISKCFEKIDHDILMKIIEDKILDRRFTNLIRKAIKAGYLEFKIYKNSITGTPQGSIISPILANIYLDKLDGFLYKLSLDYTKGDRVKPNPEYTRLRYLRNTADNSEKAKSIFKQMQKISYGNPMDNDFRRLTFVRYADDWLIGIRGPLEDAKSILDKIRYFLAEELKLELSESKTIITHVSTQKARFLGVLIGRSKITRFSRLSSGQPVRNALRLRFEAPIDTITKKLTAAKFIEGNKTKPKFLWLGNTKDQIITLYNSIVRGYLNYYSFVNNYSKMAGWIYFNLKSSCAKLLAAKFTLKSQNGVYKKFGKNLKGRDKIAFIKIKYTTSPWNFSVNTKDYIKTLYAEKISIASLNNLICGLCGSSYRVEMHLVRMMKDLNPKLSHLDKLMVNRRRKQIPLCRECHMKKHSKKK